MDRKKLFKRLGHLIIALFIVNFLANTFYWYYTVWWSDMPMHFFGGFWVALSLIWVASFKKVIKKKDLPFYLEILFGVLVVGVLWEIFEYYFINHIAGNPFNLLDTISDVFFDMAGAEAAVIYFWNNILIKEQDRIQYEVSPLTEAMNTK